MKELWGGMYDLNGDGFTDMAEQYSGFRIWEEMNDIRENDDDMDEEEEND